MSRWIGVDPGKSGGLALISNGTVEVAPLGKMTRQDIYEWLCLQRRSDYPDPVRAVIEKVHAMPGQGVTSMFNFGVSYGELRMALVAASISFEEVTPGRWQQAVGVRWPKGTSKPERKRLLKQRAQELFPEIQVTLATADALLIAEYCRRTNGG